MGNWFDVEGSTNSFYLVERPRGPLLMYWRSWALQEGTRHLWAQCQKDHGMQRDFYERLEADLVGLTRDDLGKARDGLTKLKQTLGALVAKAKKTVHEQRKAGPRALKKAGTALRKEREQLFKDYAPGAVKFNKAAKNYYFLRGKGVARKLVSPQEDFRPLGLIVQSMGSQRSLVQPPHLLTAMPFKSWALMHRPCVRLVNVRLVILCLIQVSAVPCVSKPPAKKAKVEGGRPRGRPPHAGCYKVYVYYC